MFMGILITVAVVVAATCGVILHLINHSQFIRKLKIWQIILRFIGAFVTITIGLSAILLFVIKDPVQLTPSIVLVITMGVFGGMAWWGVYHSLDGGKLKNVPCYTAVIGCWFALTSCPAVIIWGVTKELLSMFPGW